MASAWLSAETTSSVRQPTAPGPAPASQTWPRSNCGSCADSRASDSSRLIAHLFGRDGRDSPAYSSSHERSDPPFATRLDDRRLLRRGGEGGLRGAAHRRIPRPGRDRAAGRQARRLRARRMGARRGFCARRRGQGCRRRPRRDAWRAAARHGQARRGRCRRHLQGRPRRRHGDAARPADPARRAGDQSGAAQDDRRGDRARRPARRPISRSRSPCRTATRWR